MPWNHCPLNHKFFIPWQYAFNVNSYSKYQSWVRWHITVVEWQITGWRLLVPGIEPRTLCSQPNCANQLTVVHYHHLGLILWYFYANLGFFCKKQNLSLFSVSFLIWMDQLIGFLLGFLIAIKILATVCSQPLSQLLGVNFCYLFELSGTLYLSGSVVWTSFIAFFRVWYIKVWVRNQYLPPSNYYISVANLLDYVRNHSISYEHIITVLPRGSNLEEAVF